LEHHSGLAGMILLGAISLSVSRKGVASAPRLRPLAGTAADTDRTASLHCGVRTQVRTAGHKDCLFKSFGCCYF
jgi:hypothetical protein